MEKLICIDIDGTILDHNGYINPEIYERIEESDDQIIIVSGRQVHQIREFGFTCDCIGSNGAEVIQNGELIMRKALEKDAIIELYNFFTTNFGNITISTEHGRYLNAGIDLTKLITDMVIAFNGSFEQTIFNKIEAEYKSASGYVKDIEEFLAEGHQISKLECTTLGMTDQLLAKFGNRTDLEVFTSIGGHIEVVPSGVNKATAIEVYKGATDYQVFAIGDGNNDIEMFELADVSFAMGNGTDALKQVATFETDSITNDGCLKALDIIASKY